MFYLDFEEKLEKLDTEKKTLLKLSDENGLDVSSKVSAIEKKEKDELEKIYSNLSPWQIVKIARHPNRPKTKDYINNIFSNFTSLFGDRLYSEDSAIISGFAFLEGKPVLILGTEKGNDMNSRIQHNFGMAKPEGYRKSQRIMKVALNCGAPCISIIIGEGGSGGAIALGTSDKVLMLSNSIYSVISPEGCSSILWKSSEYAEIASNSLRITASDCLKFNIIDEIIEEPIGGAHRDHSYIGESLKKSLLDNLNSLREKDIDDLIASRNERYLNYLP